MGSGLMLGAGFFLFPVKDGAEGDSKTHYTLAQWLSTDAEAVASSKKISKSQKNLSFASRPSKSIQYLAFVLQPLGGQPVCIHVPEAICFMLGICFAQKQKAVLLRAFIMPLFYTWLCLQWGSHTSSGNHRCCVFHFHSPDPAQRIAVLNVVPGLFFLAKIPIALDITCVENESSSAEHALLANGILHPIYLLLPSFKITWWCQMHS